MKEQAASITVAKISEICSIIPALHDEIKWERGESKANNKDPVFYFKSGSKIDILAAKESSRGQRRTAGLIEEAILVDKTTLNEIIVPVTNVDRRLPDGTRHPEENVNKSQIWITTAGWKDSFAFEKLEEFLIASLVDPDEYMILGASYEIPVKEGLLSESFIDQLRMSDTYNEDSFDREYGTSYSINIVNCGDTLRALTTKRNSNVFLVVTNNYKYSKKVKDWAIRSQAA